VKNCLILGSGRSGTSMAAGVLRNAGYYMGDRFYPTDEGNPKGYFEDLEVNAINEEILLQAHPPRRNGPISGLLTRSRLKPGQRWLAPVPIDATFRCSAQLKERIEQLTANAPVCFKDPRFSYTLDVWRPFINNAVQVCVFRNPSTTANSIVKEWERSPYLHNIPMTDDYALRVWESMYTHILTRHCAFDGSWLFIHYNQFLDGSAFDRLEHALDVTADRSFVDPSLARSDGHMPVTGDISSIYDRLCELANYSGR